MCHEISPQEIFALTLLLSYFVLPQTALRGILAPEEAVCVDLMIKAAMVSFLLF